MKYHYTSISKTLRRFRALVGHLRKRLADQSFWQWDAVERAHLLSQVRQLYRQLRQRLSARRLRPLIAGLSLMLGAAGASAQSFAPPAEAPFNLPDGGNGEYLFPVWADWDGDGDFDAIALSEVNDSSAIQFAFLENVGDAENPDFAEIQYTPFDLPEEDYEGLMCSGDLDGDGDLDLLIMNYAGYVFYEGPQTDFVYFENIGSATNPSFTAPVENPFGLMMSSDDINGPQLVDLDGDGDLDLVYSESLYDEDGSLLLFRENTGSSTAPQFAQASSDVFGMQTTSDYAVLADFADLDGDGDLDLLEGNLGYLYEGEDSYRAYVSYRENTGTVTEPVFADPVQDPFGIEFPAYSAISLVDLIDIDNDGDLDLMSYSYLYDASAEDGSFEFFYFENTTMVENDEPLLATKSWEVFPTLSRGNVNWRVFDTDSGSIHLYDSNGRQIARHTVENHRGRIDLSPYASGMYLMQLRNGRGELIATAKVIKP